MPLTFLAHQAPVVPLKIVAPRWFDGTALVVGSMAPDLFFLAHGTRWYVDGHGSWTGWVAGVVLTLALTWVVKRVVAAPLAAHLPDAGRFHLHDYGRLGSWRWPRRPAGNVVLVWSAALGVASHVVVDSFTHGFGWPAQHLPGLAHVLVVLPSPSPGLPVHVYDLLQVGGSLIGAAVTVWCLRVIGSRRLLVAWYPPAPALRPTGSSRRTLVRWATIGVIVGLVGTVTSFRWGGVQDLVIRAAAGVFAGVAVGCLRIARTMVQVS